MSSYGLLIVSGIIAATLVAEKLTKKRGKNPDLLWGAVLCGVFCGVIGARLYHVLHLWNYYGTNPIKILAVWQGGLGIYGGILFGLIGAGLYLKHKNEKVLEWADIGGVAMPLGQAIGRLGNYVNGELLPYALYELAANLALFAVLLGLYFTKRVNLASGTLFFVYLGGYGTIRLLLESTRPEVWKIFGVSVAQGISVVLIVVALTGSAWLNLGKKGA